MEWPAPRIDTSRLAKACSDDGCVSYWRACKTEAASLSCSYVFDDGNGFALMTSIEARDRKGLDEAMAAVGIVTRWQPVAAMPLAAMNVEGTGTAPPICASEPNSGPPARCAPTH